MNKIELDLYYQSIMPMNSYNWKISKEGWMFWAIMFHSYTQINEFDYRVCAIMYDIFGKTTESIGILAYYRKHDFSNNALIELININKNINKYNKEMYNFHIECLNNDSI